MKHILIKQYDGPWRFSQLSYEKEKKPNISDMAYVLFRNYSSSVNAYEIVDLIVNNRDQIISCQCRFWKYEAWSKELFDLVKFFEGRFRKKPNLLLASEETFRLIDAGSKQKVKGLKGTDFKLKFCVDEKLQKHEYRLIYDEQAFITS